MAVGYNLNKLNILYDEELASNVAVDAHRYTYNQNGLFLKRSGNNGILWDTIGNNSNNRLECKTLEVFSYFDDNLLDTNVWGDSYTDIQSSSQYQNCCLIDLSNTYDQDFGGALCPYPFIAFQENTTDKCNPIAIFMFRGRYQDGNYYVCAKITTSNENNTSAGQRLMQIGTWDSFDTSWIGGIIEDEEEIYPYPGSNNYYVMSSNSYTSSVYESEDFEILPINDLLYSADVPNANTNFSTPADATHKVYGATITITIDEVSISGDGDYLYLFLYVNGTLVAKTQIDTYEDPVDHITLPRYLMNYQYNQYHTSRNAYGQEVRDANNIGRSIAPKPMMVRAYTRPLTAREIKANTAVDQRRFLGHMNLGWTTQ